VTDETLQSMNSEEFELFMEECEERSKELGISVNYYLEEFV